MYTKKDALDKTVKPMILRWLCDLFGYDNYPHSFKDQWIRWNVWDGDLSIDFDYRQPEQVELVSKIPVRLMGTPQYNTLKIVNTHSFYLQIKVIGHINYPDIKGSKIIQEVKHVESGEDDFYTYDHEVFLSDGTSILYHNQQKHMDMKKGDFNYNATIQERFFVQFLEQKYGKAASKLVLTDM